MWQVMVPGHEDESDCSSDQMRSGRFQPAWLVPVLHLVWTTQRDKQHSSPSAHLPGPDFPISPCVWRSALLNAGIRKCLQFVRDRNRATAALKKESIPWQSFFSFVFRRPSCYEFDVLDLCMHRCSHFLCRM